jgi:hypothetical protein
MTAMSAQIAAERKKGPGLGKKDLNIHALLLTSYRFKVAVFYEKSPRPSPQQKVKLG